MDRLNDFLVVDKNDLAALFAPFDPSIAILDFSLPKDSMGNTGYVVSTSSGKFFLKLYSNQTDKVETAVYSYFRDKLNVPQLLFYDGSKSRFPFAYTITEFIDGCTLVDYLKSNHCFPIRFAREVGKMCAVMHQKIFPHDALLDDKLNISQGIPYTREKILFLLNGKPAQHLSPETVNALRKFIMLNSGLFDSIESESVLCHGDFRFGNIMIPSDTPYFIDFEFAYSGSPYNDLGHFFRRKDENVQTLVDSNVHAAFAEGYNSISDSPLPYNWLALARLCDINSMLCLLTYDNIPSEWVRNIESDILHAIDDVSLL